MGSRGKAPEQDVALVKGAGHHVILGCDWACNRCGAKLREIGRGRARPLGWSVVETTRTDPVRRQSVSPDVFVPKGAPIRREADLCPDCTEVHEDFLRGAGPGRDVWRVPDP